MEKPTINKKESGISRVVGFDPEVEKELLSYFKDKFDLDSRDLLGKEHTPELDEVIETLNGYLDEFLKEYGIDAIYIPSKNIHILDWSKLSPEQLEKVRERWKSTRAFYLPALQQIMMLTEYKDGERVRFLRSVVHEMCHMNSFGSYQKSHNGPIEKSVNIKIPSGEEAHSIIERRIGFCITSMQGDIYFKDVDESIIEELVIRFDSRYFSQIPQLAIEVEERRKARDELAHKEGDNSAKEIAYLQQGKNENGKEIQYLVSYTYPDERRIFNDLVDDIFEKNKSTFTSREEVFKVFATAIMTGRLLPVARLIEGTYGKGSFRELGEKTAAK